MLALLATAAVLAGAACPSPTVPLPPSEPHATAGPSELVAGIYIQGGAIIPGCHMRPRGPYAGTLAVYDAATGRLVARQTRRHDGRLFRIVLAPGTYTVRATDGGGLRTVPMTVRIPRHRTVRDDVFIDVP